MIKDKIEIMAPAGSWESLQAAINAGADSVYFGIDKLNMRARSSVNFTTDDLREIVDRCKENGVKTYLTLNTIMYDNDIQLASEIIDIAKEKKLDAVIASDFAVINYANEIGVEVHISTQANVSNFKTVKFFAKFADVVVLARELNLDQVTEISRRIKDQNITGPKGELIRIEMFVHGALCMAVSGKCYLSLHEWNKSANRGSCLQTCRRGYTVTDNESDYQLEIDNEYIMSPKDLRTIHFLDNIIDSGVKVLKIEGRGRSAEYVKYTVECYKEAVESIMNNNYTLEQVKKWETKLAATFNRGFWDGYYLGKKIGEWSGKYGSSATTTKIYTGDVNNYFSKINIAEFIIRTGTLEINDEIMVIGPTTGVWEGKVTGLHDSKGEITKAEKGMYVSVPVETKLRRSDKVYKIVKS